MQDHWTEQVKKNFNAIANFYNTDAILAHNIGQQLYERLEYMNIFPHTILDMGCGTGFFYSLLLQKYKQANIFEVDIAYNMLWQNQKKNTSVCVCANTSVLPFEAKSVDLIFANLLLPYCKDLHLVFKELQRILAPKGLILFSTLGPDSLKEFQEIYNEKNLNFPTFLDMHLIGDMLLEVKLKDPVLETERYTVSYPDFKHIFDDLKYSGQDILFVDSLVTKESFPDMLSTIALEYTKKYSKRDNLNLSYEIIYGHAWG